MSEEQVQSDIQGSQPLPANAAACTIDCICPTPTIHRNSCSIVCTECAKPCLLSCLLHRFTATGAVPLRNSVEWLQAFINCHELKYTCNECKQAARGDTGNSTGNYTGNVSNLPTTDNTLVKSIADLKTTVLSLTNDMTKVATELAALKQHAQIFAGVPSSDPSNKPAAVNSNKLYSEVASTDIASVIRSAVAESLTARKKDDQAARAIMIYGLPESTKDINQVRRLLEDDVDSVVRTKRLGKNSSPSTSSSSSDSTTCMACRPLMVELATTEDRDWVLHNAGMLVRAYKGSKVRISRYLTSIELEQVKNLRAECAHLNRNSSSTTSDSKGKFVVIDGRIMERQSNGKLMPYIQAANNNSLSPKNV